MSAKPIHFRQSWSQPFSAKLAGLALARECHLTLAWDANHWLYLLNHQGQRQAQWHCSGPLTSACCADDGSAIAVIGGHNELWWLAPDLTLRWHRVLQQPATAVALDCQGQYLTMSDSGCQVRLFTRDGMEVFSVPTPRPLHHLIFVPGAPLVIGAADYGLVACYDPRGKQIWRDGLVAHVGSLASNGDGTQIILACFSEGIRRYSITGQNSGRLPNIDGSRLAAIAYDGRRILAAGLGKHIQLLDSDGQLRLQQEMEKPPIALGFGPLGDHAIIALAEGSIVAVSFTE